MRKLPSATRATFAVCGAGLLWAGAGPIGQGASLAPLSLAELRLAGAALALGVVLGPRRLRQVLGAQRLGLLLAAAAGMAAFQWSYFAAVAGVGASFATWASVATGPLWAAALSRLIGGYDNAMCWSSAMLITCGLILLAGDMPLTGLGFSLLSGLAYAAYALAASRATAYSGMDGSLAVTTLSLAGGALALLPFSGTLTAQLRHHDWRLQEAASLVLLALGCTAFAYWLFARGLRRLAPGKALALQWIQPVATEFLAARAPGYHLSLWSLSGMCLITFVLLGGRLPSGRSTLSRQPQS